MRGVVACVMGLILALALAACAGASAPVTSPVASAPPAGEWKIERREDRIAGKPQATALLITRSRNARIARERPGLGQLASLQLLCFDNRPIVRLHFNYRVGSKRSAKVAYRFDDKPGRNAPVRFLPDFQTMVIEDEEDVARFAAELRAADVLVVRVASLIVGQSVAEFRVGGAPAALEAAFADCPLPA